MEKIRPMARPSNDESHRVDLAADIHGGSPRQLVLKLFHHAIDVRGNAAEIAILHADVQVDDRLNVVLRRHVRAGAAGNGGQIIRAVATARWPGSDHRHALQVRQYESMRYCGVWVATL
jgi:hypothetical protein